MIGLLPPNPLISTLAGRGGILPLNSPVSSENQVPALYAAA